MHNWWPDTWDFVIEGSPAATGAQLRDNPEEREKWPIRPNKPFTAIITRLWRRTESEAPEPARRPAQQGHRSPYQSTATAGLPQFSALSNQAPVVEQQRVSQPVKNCTCAISTAFCTVSTVYLSLSRSQNIHHSVDELKLRHHEELDNGLLEHELHGHRGRPRLHASSLPSIYIPPWAGGELLK